MKSTLNRKRLYQQVADNLESLIFNGTYAVGSRLPSEQELADEYGVSRNVVREALKRLKEHGLVIIRTGSGTYVAEPSTESVSDAFQRLIRHNTLNLSIGNFYEIRRMIEPEAARIAAERATNEQIEELTRTYKTMESNQDNRQGWSKADLTFHRMIAAATHNPLVLSIIDPLTAPLSEVISAGREDPTGIEAGLDAHRRILDAIRDRNGQAAFQAMLDHLNDSEARMSKLGVDLLQKD